MRRRDRRQRSALKQRLNIGTIGYPVAEKLLYPHVDIIELQMTRRSVPKAAVAKKIREAAPERVRFSVAMPSVFFESPKEGGKLGGELENYGQFQVSEENRRLFDRLNRFADNLLSDTLVLLTPAEFTPTPAMREALSRFLDAMPVGDRTIVWQPSGPWTDTQAVSFAKALGVVVAVDPLRDEPPRGQTAYFRLGPFAAMGSRVGVYDLERIIAAAESFETAAVVFETAHALDDVRNLKQMR